MNAYRCDRCGEYFSKFEEPHIDINGISELGLGTRNMYSDNAFKVIHLCRGCILDFEFWWNHVVKVVKNKVITG